jgi:hypothetical protein
MDIFKLVVWAVVGVFGLVFWLGTFSLMQYLWEVIK